MSASSRGRRGALLLLLVAVAAIDVVGFDWGLPSRIAPHPDDVARPALTALRQGFLAPTKYPKLQYLVLAVADAPYLAWAWARGDLRPGAITTAGPGEASLADPLHSYTVLLRIARAVSVLFHLGAVLLLFLTLERLARHWLPAVLCAAIFGLAPEITLYSRMSNVDMPMVFWIAAALHAYARLLDRPGFRRLLVLAVLSAAAAGTKEQAAFALVGLDLHAAWLVIRRGSGPARARLRTVAGAGLAGLLIWALLAGFLFDPGGAIERLGWWRGELRSFAAGFRNNPEFATLPRLVLGVAERFVYTGGLGVALAVLLALVLFLRRPDRLGAGLLTIWLAYPAITVGLLGFVQARYLLPAVYLGMVFAGRMIGRSWPAAGHRPASAMRVILALCLAASLVHAVSIDRALVLEPRRRAAAWLVAHSPATASVETYANDNYLPCLELAGLRARRCKDFTRPGFAQRSPDLALVTDGFDWARPRSENAYIDWLQDGPPGYHRVAFGPAADAEPTFYLAPETRVRIWPNITILVRSAEGSVPR